MNNKKAYLSAFGYSLFVGVSFLMTKLMVLHASPQLILAHRFAIALTVYTGILLTGKIKFKMNKKKLLSILPLVPFYPLMFFTLQTFGMRHANASEAGIIFATIPILTVMLLAIVGKRPSLVQALCVVTSVIGVLVVFSENMAALDIANNSSGIVLLFLSALSFSVYTILVKRTVKVVPVHELTFSNICIGALWFNFMFLMESGNVTTLISHYAIPFKSTTYFLSIVYSGTLAMIGTSFFSNYALKFLSPQKFSVFANLSTLISIVSGALILNEALGMHHYIGSTLIILGVIGTNFSSVLERRLIGEMEKVLN